MKVQFKVNYDEYLKGDVVDLKDDFALELERKEVTLTLGESGKGAKLRGKNEAKLEAAKEAKAEKLEAAKEAKAEKLEAAEKAEKDSK